MTPAPQPRHPNCPSANQPNCHVSREDASRVWPRKQRVVMRTCGECLETIVRVSCQKSQGRRQELAEIEESVKMVVRAYSRQKSRGRRKVLATIRDPLLLALNQMSCNGAAIVSMNYVRPRGCFQIPRILRALVHNCRQRHHLR